MVNKGRQPIKVKVGSTVTIPCKIQNKNTLLDRIWDPHSFNSFVCLNFIRLFEWTTEIVDKIVSQGGQMEIQSQSCAKYKTKVHKHQKYTLEHIPGPLFFLFLCLFKWTTEIVDGIVNKGGQPIKYKAGDMN